MTGQMVNSLKDTVKMINSLDRWMDTPILEDQVYGCLRQTDLAVGVRTALVDIAKAQKRLLEVVELVRRDGLTWSQIGRVFGITAIECRNRYGDFEL